MHDPVQSSRTMQSSRKTHEKKTNIMNNVVSAGGNKMLGLVNVIDWAQGS